MQVMHEQHEDDLDPGLLPQQSKQKIRLIDTSVAHFRRLVRWSMGVALARIGFFFIVFLNDETFLCSHQSNRCDGWSMIFYILASLMDLLVVLNDAQMLRFLKKQAPALANAKQQLSEGRAEVSGTALGAYSNYLSVSSILKVYKLRPRSMNSISKTIRYLEFLVTFLVFGWLALDSQYKNLSTPFQTTVLWIFILTIYLSVFEIDLMTLEAASGPYIQAKTIDSPGQGQPGEYLQIKENYVRRIRRPFEVIYLITILVLLAGVILFFKASLLSLMTGACILALMVELVYEKHMQNQLLGVNLASVPKQFLTPEQVRWEVARLAPHTHTAITSATRVAIVLLVMAYFRSPALTAPHSLLLASAFLLLFLGQAVKGEWAQRGRLYIVRGKRQEEDGGECSICLLGCEKGQRVLALPCFAEHVFHAECLRSWLKERKECPLCRHSLQHYEIIN